MGRKGSAAIEGAERREGFRQNAGGQESTLPYKSAQRIRYASGATRRGANAPRSREPASLAHPSSFRAHSNSAASVAKPSMNSRPPGPGVGMAMMRRTSSANPNAFRAQRFASFIAREIMIFSESDCAIPIDKFSRYMNRFGDWCENSEKQNLSG